MDEMQEKMEKARLAKKAFYKKFEPLIKALAPKMRSLTNGLTKNASGDIVIRAHCEFRDAASYPSQKVQKEIRELVGTTFSHKGTDHPVEFGFAHSDIRAQSDF